MVAIASTQAAFCATLLDELSRGGVTDAVICPGSRSTPLALAAVESGLTTHVRLDERSAGFFALGLARITGRPSVIIVTSGTAAAELHAAVVEAFLDRIPLVVLTADRPPALQHIGAPQTIDQKDLFVHSTRFAFDPGPVAAFPREAWRSLGARLVLEAGARPGVLAGPVHLNVPLVEPLVADPDEIPNGKPFGLPWNIATGVADAVFDSQLRNLWGRRGVLLVGEGAGGREEIEAGSTALGWPVVADPRSGARIDRPGVVSAMDPILRSDAARSSIDPEVIVMLGAPHASKVVGEWVTECAQRGVEILRVGLDGPSRHPSTSPTTFVIAEASAFWRSAMTAQATPPQGWLEQWSSLEAAAQQAISFVLREEDFCEPGIARFLSEALAGHAPLVASSSMPIRDLEWFGRPAAEPLIVLSNRGANGIDGVVSTAMGAASAGLGPVVALVGDLTFLHDVSALVDGVDDPWALTIVVLDNNGGGIFSFLPQRTQLDDGSFEELFGTPRSVDPAAVAAGFGITPVVVDSLADLDDAVEQTFVAPGLRVVICRVPPRDRNVEIHRRLNEAVVEAVAAEVAQR